MIKKNFSNLKTKGKLLNWIKDINKKPTGSIILNDEKLEIFPIKSGKGKEVPSDHSFSTSYWSPS